MEVLLTVLLTIIGALALVGLLVIYSSASWGFVLYKMWGWFVLPVFPMLPSINFIEALGLMFIISLFKNQPTTMKEEFVDNSKNTTYFLLGPWMTLLVAWFIKIIWM